ncbi:hypothetical protein T439DRAFT_327617 [Meredithblackwellia eburnea MCA 4105]
MSQASGSLTICAASVSYKKRQGMLILSKRALTWSPSGSPPYDLDIVNHRLASLFSSKEGGAKVMIKVGATPLNSAFPPQSTTPAPDQPPPPDDTYSFTFTAASSAVSDREIFKRELSAVIAQNRQRAADGINPHQPAQQGTNTATPTTPSSSGAATPTARAREKQSATSSSSAAAASGSNINALRRLALDSDPALKSLHYDLCISSRLISEAEFWAGREDLLQLHLAEVEAQGKKGRTGEMVDPKPETGEGGEVTVKITPALIREIFEEYPMVLKAYHDNVPDPLDDQQFWTRYFQSKLFNRNRTTNRAAVNTIKDDDIFDKYLGEEDDGIEPKHMEEHEIYRLLDLAATEEDQHEVDRQVDFTMKAGGQRSSLPLMRRFNEHSERLLNQSLGKLAPSTGLDLNPGNAGARNYYADILLDDLTTSTAEDRIVLNMQDRSTSSGPAAASGSGGANGAAETMETDEVDRIVRGTKDSFEVWEPNLGEFEADKTSIKLAMVDMLGVVKLKVERASRDGHGSSAFNDARLRELTTLQASSNEFLRQFWSSVLPPRPNDLSAAALAPPEERAKKAAKMVGYIQKMIDRVEEVERKVAEEMDRETTGEGRSRKEVERVRVVAALQPVKDALVNATSYFKDRAPRASSAAP